MKYILIEKAPELINVIRNSIIMLPYSDGGTKIVVKGDERLHMFSNYPALHNIVVIYKGDDAYQFNTRELMPSWMKETVEEYIAPEYSGEGVCVSCGLHAYVNKYDMCQSCTLIDEGEVNGAYADFVEWEPSTKAEKEQQARDTYYGMAHAERFNARVEKFMKSMEGEDDETVLNCMDATPDYAERIAMENILFQRGVFDLPF